MTYDRSKLNILYCHNFLLSDTEITIFKLELACFVLILHYRNPHCRINLPVQICFCIRLLKSNLVSLVYYLILLFEIMAFTRIRVTQFHNEKAEGDGKRWAFKGTPRRRDFVGGWLIRCNVFSLTKVAKWFWKTLHVISLLWRIFRNREKEKERTSYILIFFACT